MPAISFYFCKSYCKLQTKNKRFCKFLCSCNTVLSKVDFVKLTNQIHHTFDLNYHQSSENKPSSWWPTKSVRPCPWLPIPCTDMAVQIVVGMLCWWSWIRCLVALTAVMWTWHYDQNINFQEGSSKSDRDSAVTGRRKPAYFEICWTTLARSLKEVSTPIRTANSVRLFIRIKRMYNA
jgi:hypothetical protein